MDIWNESHYLLLCTSLNEGTIMLVDSCLILYYYTQSEHIPLKAILISPSVSWLTAVSLISSTSSPSLTPEWTHTKHWSTNQITRLHQFTSTMSVGNTALNHSHDNQLGQRCEVPSDRLQPHSCGINKQHKQTNKKANKTRRQTNKQYKQTNKKANKTRRQTNKQTNKKANKTDKQTNKKANKTRRQINKQTNKQQE